MTPAGFDPTRPPAEQPRSGGGRAGPHTPAPHSPGPRRPGNGLLAALAALTALLGALVVLAPVRADDPVVTWPQAGEAPTSTVLPLSPYRPLRFDAEIPCGALQALDRRPGGGTALASQPAAHGPGMRVSAADGQATFWISGQEVLVEPLPQGACSYRVLADASGVRVLRDGVLLAERPELLPPQVSELATDAEGTPAAAGLAVELHTDARYESSPTVLKTVLLVAHAVSLAVLLVLAWRRFRGDPATSGLRRPKRSAADAVLLVVSVAWVFLGPMNMDDGWYMMMARNAVESGYLGNFVYMFNVTENPFVLSQYLLQFWGELGGWSLWWMRLVPAALGVATWVLLRFLLATLLGRAADVRAVPWALLVAHLVWWLPWGMTLRPEPAIVACSAATLLFAELARRRRSVGALAVATVFAALAITASPSGLVAIAPLVLALPWLADWMREQPWIGRVAAVLLALAAVTVVVPVGFADATLGNVLEATRVHQWYYLSFSWYEEFVHYQTLLDHAGWARRMPVLLTLAALLVVAISSGRGGTGNDPFRRLMLVSAVTSAIALLLIAFSPTKWVSHFHAVAAAPTVLLAATLLRSPMPKRPGVVVTGASALIIVGAVALGFAGNNWWVPFSDAGQRFGNHVAPDLASGNLQPHFGPLYLRNPLPWFALALLVGLWAKWRRQAGKLVRLTPDRAVLGAASLGSVLLMLALFVWAPIATAPGWTVAGSNLATMLSRGCGLASHVKVQLPSRRQLAEPVGPARPTGDFANDRPVPLATGPWPEPSEVWHDDLPDGTTTGTGEIVTGWYPVPEVTAGTNVTVPVAGALRDQRLEFQFGRGTGSGFEVVSTEPLHSDLRRPLLEWQQLTAELPERADAVRVVVGDRVTGSNSWVAIAEPRLTEARPITELTRSREVLANHIGSPHWPCVDQVGVRDGITDTPSVRIIVDNLLPMTWPDNISFLEWGGAWVQTTRAWVQTKLPTELRPQGLPRLPWGQVFVVRYRHPVGQYDLRVEHVIRSGLTRLPTLADNDYPDIVDNAGTQVEEVPEESVEVTER